MKIAQFSAAKLTLADQALVSGASLVTGIVIGRALGVTALGIFTLGMLCVLLAQNVHQALLSAPVMSLLPALDEAEKAAVRKGLPWLNLMLSTLCSLAVVLALLSTQFFSPEWGFAQSAWLWGAVVFTSLIHDFLRRLAFAESQVARALVIDGIRFVSQISALIYLAVLGKLTLDHAIAVVMLSAALGCITSLRVLPPNLIGLSELRALFVRYWVFGRWLLASALMQWSTSNLFMVVGGGMIGASAVGALRAAAQFAQPIHVVMIALDNRMPVAAAEILASQGPTSMRRYIQSVWKRGSLGILIVGGAVCLFSEPLIGLVYGEAFRPYGSLIPFFVASALFRFIATPIMAGLRALEKTAVIFRAHLSVLAFTILTCIPLLHYGGLNGAGFGMAAIGAVLALHLGIAYRRLGAQSEAGTKRS